MDNLMISIKLNSSVPVMQKIIKHVKDSYNEDIKYFYYTSNKDAEIIDNLLSSMKINDFEGHPIVFIVYRKTSGIFIKKLYVGKIECLEHEGSSYQIFYTIKNEITSPLAIDNYMAYSNLDIERDFEEDSHINIEDSYSLIRQLSYAITIPQNAKIESQKYSEMDNEENLSEFAQKNEFCLRFFNFLEPSSTRGEYQRDYDRIVHSKAFRRMVDKAQIFTANKGDHYRTRLTHTLCVVQIARSIAAKLNMNVALTEAIALGHDLGHTPFGHQGERTLKEMAQKYAKIGFKHNYQSLNVTSVLEEEYIEGAGLDLSVQVLEGIWKHTKIREKSNDQLICDPKDFLPSEISNEMIKLLYPEDDFCSTIEGQIVFVADEIAQRSHDLDDALSAGLLDVDSLIEALSLKKLHILRNEIVELKTKIQDDLNKTRMFVSEKELLISRIASVIIQYFIKDVADYYNKFIESDSEEIGTIRTYFVTNSRINRQMIYFSDEGQILNDYLEKIVKKQVINSPEVAAFDDKAKRIVSKLFELYYDNPRLLHDGTLQRIFIEMRKQTDNVIHFQEGDINLVNDEWKRIKCPDESLRLRDLRETFPSIDLSAYDDVLSFQKSLSSDSDEYKMVAEYIDACITEYKQKQKILVRSICDFISGMTDTYATNEYRKLLY